MTIHAIRKITKEIEEISMAVFVIINFSSKTVVIF